MVANPQNTHFTEAEYLAVERASDIRHEFVDGYILAMAGASEAHIDISGNLFALFRAAFGERPCKAYPMDMRVYAADEASYFYPDVTIVCGKRQFKEDESAATLLNPTCLIEVLSPSTELYDRTTKFKHYQTIQSVQHYVLVAQDKPQIEVFTRGDDTSWILTQADSLDGTIALPELDVTLALADVYAQITFEKPRNNP